MPPEDPSSHTQRGNSCGNISCMNPRTGTVKRVGKAWQVRVTYIDQVTRKRRDIRKRFATKNEAHKELQKYLDDVEANGSVREERTFHDLARYYREHRLMPPVFSHGKKIAGMRSWATERGLLDAAETYFGHRLLKTITFADLRSYRLYRVKSPVVRHVWTTNAKGEKVKVERKTERSLSRVNRELAFLRRILNIAQQEGWIRRNPFHAGESLISKAHERERQRILSRAEEKALLAACETPKRQHIVPILIAALDTGARRGELLSIRWRDLDVRSGKITIHGTKTEQTRIVGMTPRLQRELIRLREERKPAATDRVFGLTDIKRAFTAARSAAKIQGLRFHDLRHTFATRLIEADVPIATVARLLGHSDVKMTYRYVNLTEDSIERAVTALALDVNDG